MVVMIVVIMVVNTGAEVEAWRATACGLARGCNSTSDGVY